MASSKAYAPRKKSSDRELDKGGDPELGAIIMDARRSRGLTQSDLGEQLGVTKAAISQWEGGSVRIKDANRRALAAALDIPLDVMFGVSAATMSLTGQERLLVEQFRQLPPDMRIAFLLILSSYPRDGHSPES